METLNDAPLALPLPVTGLVVAALVVALGLFVYGLRDVRRFSLRRTLAVAQVAVRESLRRRVLWVAPLAMIGVVAVGLFQRATDEQDAVRQTAQAGLFAATLLVVAASTILACTSLPREIESKIIFSVITKPLTRLELLVGKLVGLSCVAGLIAATMGVFLGGYLALRAAQLGRSIDARIASGTVSDDEREDLQNRRALGLLTTRAAVLPGGLEVARRLPDDLKTGPTLASSGQTVIVRFNLPDDLASPEAIRAVGSPKAGELVGLKLNVGWEQIGRIEAPAPPAPFQQPQAQYGWPTVTVGIFAADGSPVVQAAEINAGKDVDLAPPDGSAPTTQPTATVSAYLTADGAAALLGRARAGLDEGLQLTLSGGNQNFGLLVAQGAGAPPAVTITAPSAAGDKFVELLPASAPTFRGAFGRVGQSVDGPSEPNAADGGVGRFRFAELPQARAGGAPVVVEVRADVDRTDDFESVELITEAELSVVDPATNQLRGAPVTFVPENGKTVLVPMPADAFAAERGPGELRVRVVTPRHSVELLPTSLAVVVGQGSVASNLVKATLNLWLLGTLIAAVGIFCSTFLSWPIAVVLALTVLLARGLVELVGEALSGGAFGSTVASGAGIENAAAARVVSSSVDAMAWVLATVARFLPDLSVYGTTQWVERGLVVPFSALGSALLTTLAFGLPLVTLAYVVFRQKEVAP